MSKRYIIFLAFISLLFIIPGCGGGGNDAPAESTITFSPSSATVTIAEGAPPAWYVYRFTIVATNPDGIPYDNIDLSIFYPWAEPGDRVVQFYDGDPSKGAPAKDSPMSVKTDENGSYTLFFVYVGGGGAEYSGDIQVTSGSVFGSASFEVKTEAAE